MDSEATLKVEVEFEVNVLRCGCGKPRSHAPYVDGQPRRNFLRRLRARALRRSLVNAPCLTPRIERQTVTRTYNPADLAALGG